MTEKRETIPWDALRERTLPRLERRDPDRADKERCDRVRRAMLAMQRASWEQGVAAQACLEEGDAELTILMAREAVLRQGSDGRLAQLGQDPGITDPGAAGEAVIFAALATGDSSLARGAERMLAFFLHEAPRSASGVLLHQIPSPYGELWSDSFYMAPPFLALAGRPKEAVEQIRGLRNRLWIPDRRLFAHRYSEGRACFVREAAWGVGNGWAAAGMARTLSYIPAGMATEREELSRYVREVLWGCLAHQRGDGLFHDVVDDPATFVETNLSQMLAWTIYRGVAAGWLDPALRPRAEGLRSAALSRVDASGLVQGVCSSPSFDRPGTAAEGQAFFLMMEAVRGASAGGGP